MFDQSFWGSIKAFWVQSKLLGFGQSKLLGFDQSFWGLVGAFVEFIKFNEFDNFN